MTPSHEAVATNSSAEKGVRPASRRDTEAQLTPSSPARSAAGRPRRANSARTLAPTGILGVRGCGMATTVREIALRNAGFAIMSCNKFAWFAVPMRWNFDLKLDQLKIALSAYDGGMSVHDTSQTALSDQVAAEVRALMGRFDLLQADIAEALGVTQTQVSRRLRGHTPFTLSDVQLLADYFQTTPLVLLGYMQEPRPRKPERGSNSYTARDSNPEPAD